MLPINKFRFSPCVDAAVRSAGCSLRARDKFWKEKLHVGGGAADIDGDDDDDAVVVSGSVAIETSDLLYALALLAETRSGPILRAVCNITQAARAHLCTCVQVCKGRVCARVHTP